MLKYSVFYEIQRESHCLIINDFTQSDLYCLIIDLNIKGIGVV